MSARVARWWLATVPGIGVTRSRSLAEAEKAARGLTLAMPNVDAESVEVSVVPALDSEVDEQGLRGASARLDPDDVPRS